MSPTLLVYWGLLVIVVSERMAELVLSKRHADLMLRRGGVEVGRGHYPPMIALHAFFLVGCAVEPYLANRPFLPWLGFPMLALALGAQTLRWWAIDTLGDYWNTRVIVLPRAPRITGGPYRYYPHPNYVAVIVEGLALPLIQSAWITAAVFSLLNALILMVRLRTENQALTTMRTA